MKTRVSVQDLSTDTTHNEDVQLAFTCPYCNTGLTPRILDAAFIPEEDEIQNQVYVFNFCSRCSKCFISCHTYNDDDGGYDFEFSAPHPKSNYNFSKDIKSLSPSFVEIYLDALTAEDNNLLSICGMGYRKALEFLVKDYAIFLNPSHAEKIHKQPLASCINEFINDERLKALAVASAWLGNDETHYVKKHMDYGISDLKIFLNAFVTFIDSELAVSHAQALISKGKK